MELFIAVRGAAALALSGPDRRAFLNGLVSNDVAKLPERRGLPCCLLTPKGRLQADFLVYDAGEEFVLLGVGAALRAAGAALRKVIVLSESRLEDRQGWAFVWLSGGASALRQPPFSPWEARVLDGGALWLSDPRLRPDGAWLAGPGAVVELLKARLAAAGLAEGSHDDFEALRVEAGVPLFGVDAGPEDLPLEVRLDAAVSFSKGCYMGQETMSRVHHLGHVNRRLCGLKVQGAPPGRGTPVLAGGAEIGKVSSVVSSPRLRSTLALAVIKVESAAVGSSVLVGSQPAQVVDLPLS